MQSHLGRRLDLTLPSNRQAVALSAGFLAAAALIGQLRPVPADDAEQLLLDAIAAGDRSMYGRIAAMLIKPFASRARQIRVLRGFNAWSGATTVFTTWALARELLPDQPGLAAPAAALMALQPAVCRLASRADSAALELLGANGELMLICRIASRSTGQPPTPLDYLAVSGSAAGAALLSRELRPLPLLLALAAGYDALRDRAWPRLLVGVGGAGAAGAAALAATNLVDDSNLAQLPASARLGLDVMTLAGLLGMFAALLLHGRDDIRARADDGTRLSAAAVCAARWLAVGWTALRLAQRNQYAALDALAPLCIGAVAGVAGATQRLNGGGASGDKPLPR
jgi:hypothetical protein